MDALSTTSTSSPTLRIAQGSVGTWIIFSVCSPIPQSPAAWHDEQADAEIMLTDVICGVISIILPLCETSSIAISETAV